MIHGNLNDPADKAALLQWLQSHPENDVWIGVDEGLSGFAFAGHDDMLLLSEAADDHLEELLIEAQERVLLN